MDRLRQKKLGKTKLKRRSGNKGEDGSVLSLRRLCLLSLADNMKELWVKDYADNYLDQYFFRHIMGPFSLLPGELVEELMWLLCSRKQLSRAALHLLLVPQLRNLSLDKCPGLVTSALCPHIATRCQGLWGLNLSGAQQLPSKILSETLRSLPGLRSLSLAGTPCDGSVIRTIAQCCRFLRHLDASRCHLISPAALLPLGGLPSISPSGASFHSPSAAQSPSSSSTAFSSSPLPLSSLLALDIGLGKQEGDAEAAAAYLLLSLPCLERLSMDSLARACSLIQHRQFEQTHEFTDREGVARLEVVWGQCMHAQGEDRRTIKQEGAAADEENEDEEWGYLEEYGSDGEGDAGGQLELNCSENHIQEDEPLTLRLKDVKGLACDSLDSFSRLCPNIHSVSVSVDDNEEALLARGLQVWSGQLQSLSVHYQGPLVELLPALHIVGSSLLFLSLEGVKTSPLTPLLEVIEACPSLRELLISAEPPATPQEEEEEDEEDQQEDRDLPRLPYLCSLTFKFSYEHSQMKPVMSWMALKRVLKCLLTGSPLLARLSLVSLPCPVNSVLQDALQREPLFQHSTDAPLLPLRRLQHVDLSRTNVNLITLKSIMQQNKILRHIDVSRCWQISHQEWLNSKIFSTAQVVWS
ncbi:uncharacterized protein V6R79_006609 [Siganus canaliculatus]